MPIKIRVGLARLLHLYMYKQLKRTKMEICKRLFINELKAIMAILGTDTIECFKPFKCEVFYYGRKENEEFTKIARNPETKEIIIYYNRLWEDGELHESGDDILWHFSRMEINDIRDGFLRHLDDDAKDKIESFFDNLA